jgi:hypothetical protein
MTLVNGDHLWSKCVTHEPDNFGPGRKRQAVPVVSRGFRDKGLLELIPPLQIEAPKIPVLQLPDLLDHLEIHVTSKERSEY